jgi:2',3'-cyclic-nucleotide 2'-phosphodiesterase (5'-nucleotidase family)
MKLRHLAVPFLLFFLSGFPSALGEEPPKPKEVRILLLHTNDIHGQVRPLGRKKDRGGLAALFGAVTRIRKEAAAGGAHVFLIDAGDFYQGTPEGNLSKGRLVLDLLGRMRYDVAAVGNHEFDNGWKNLKALAERAGYPLLSANIVEAATGKPPAFLKAFVLRQAGPVKVGFVGLTTAQVPLYTFPEHTRGLAFQNPLETAAKAVARARKAGADLIVAVTHLGLREDIDLAKALPGIDVIVGGHSHTVLKKGVRSEDAATLIVQAGSKAQFLGRVDLGVDAERRTLLSAKASLLPLVLKPEDAGSEFAAEIAKHCKDIDREMDVVIGSAAEDIRRGGSRYAGRSSPLGNLITDIMRRAAGCDLALHNRTGMRDNYRKGDITLRDVYRVSPFGNTVVAMKLSGRQIQSLLKYALTYGSRYLLEISGGVVEYSRTGEREVRIQSFQIKGQPVAPDRLYKVATNNFLAAGGDGHRIFTQGSETLDTGLLLRDIVAEHVRRHSPLKADAQPRVRKVKE